MSYYFAKTSRLDEAVRRTTDALKQEGFGIITEIDVKDTFKKKMNVDFRSYQILGACDPALAHEVLQIEDETGPMLPCNTVVQDQGNGKTEVAAVDPIASVQTFDNPRLKEAARADNLIEGSITPESRASAEPSARWTRHDRRKPTCTLALWASRVVILAAVAWPYRLHAQDSASSPGSMGMQGGEMMQQHMMSPGMMMPSMDAANGRKLFASKGCVVCHSVNGIGGKDATALDASTMPGMTNPFDFVANMWRGAEPMIELQREELGGQIEFTGQELSDIIAFLHHEAEQKKFSEADIPPNIKAAMEKMEQGEGGTMQGGEGGMSGMKMAPDSGATGN